VLTGKYSTPISAAAAVSNSSGFSLSYLPILERFQRDLEKQYKAADDFRDRYMLFGYSANAGYGAQFQRMLMAYPAAVWENRTFILMPSLTKRYKCRKGDETYSSCFKTKCVGPQSACEESKVSEIISKFKEYPMW